MKGVKALDQKFKALTFNRIRIFVVQSFCGGCYSDNMAKTTVRECVVCGGDFDPNSLLKRRVGGLSTTCPECSSEHSTKYLGLSAGDGKQAGITVLKFSSPEDREAYRQMWWVNSGMGVGKACQLGRRKSDPGVRFSTVTQSTATNHKGRMT